MQTAKHIMVLSPFLSVINPPDILQKWITERGNWSIKCKFSKEMKNDNAGNGLIEEIANDGNVNTPAVWETLAM